MNAKEILGRYLQKKREIGILETDLQHLNQIVMIKTAKYGDEQSGEVLSIEEKYWRNMEEKRKLELRIAELKRDVAKVDKVIELISMTHPHECNAMLLRHVQNKQNYYIEAQIGFSKNVITNKIRFAENEFERLMNS